MTGKIEIAILSENCVGDLHFEAEWGLSLFIKVNDKKILFDTGLSGIYVRNAQRLELRLEQTDFIVLSHHHQDHTRGLQYHRFNRRKKIICHPSVLNNLPTNESDKIRNDFDILPSEKPLELSKNIFFLGEIPRKTDFEKGKYENDEMVDDSAIAIKSDKGLIVISGCSHAGICNICEYAKEVTGERLYSVLGGFHLFEDDPEAINGTLSYFKSEKTTSLFPMHCIDFPTLVKFHATLHCKKYSSGDIIHLPYPSHEKEEKDSFVKKYFYP